jgi:hypothetical protein
MQDVQSTVAEAPAGRASVAAATVFLSPTRSFQEIRRGAGWLLPFLILVVVAVGAASLSQPLQTAIAEARMSQFSEAQREAAATQMRVGSIIGLVFAPVQVIIALLLSALVFLGVLRAAGHELSFKQIFTGQCYAGLISSALGSLVFGLLIRMKANQGELSGMGDLPRMGLDLLGGEGFLRGFLSAFNLFAVWWLVVLVYGYAAMVGKKPRDMVAPVLGAGILWLVIGGALGGLGFAFGSR